MKRLNSTHAWNRSVTSMAADASMENVGPQTSALAKSGGRVPTVTSAFPCPDATMVLALMPLNAGAKVVGKEPTVIHQLVVIAPTATASVPTNVSAIMAGLERTATSVRRWLDVSTEDASTTLTPASVMKAGKATSATELHATWTATTDSAMHQEMELPTSASASQVGGTRTAASAAHTGDAPTKARMLVSTLTSVSASGESQIPMACATTPS